jgi:hypothetical protein
MPGQDTSLDGKKVKIYYNLHKNCLSVQYKGKIIAYLDEIELKDAQFKVSESGRQRVLENNRKNVHAYVVGTATTTPIETASKELLKRNVTYNPYKYNSFVERDKLTPIFYSPHCRITGKQIIAA